MKIVKLSLVPTLPSINGGKKNFFESTIPFSKLEFSRRLAFLLHSSLAWLCCLRVRTSYAGAEPPAVPRGIF